MLRLGLLILLSVQFMEAEDFRVGPDDNWFGILTGGKLRPGDNLILEEGVFTDRRLLKIEVRGTAENPVVIRGEEGKSVVLKRPDAKQNSLNLVGCQHLMLRNLEITGGSSGIRISGTEDHPAKFIRLENLHIHHIGGPAITANHSDNVYEALHFRRNHIHHTGGHGEAFYLGCNNDAEGGTPGYIFNSIVEENYIHDLNGPEISQGDGIELKDGSYGNIVRDNVIHDTKYPGITVYGTDGRAPNIIERNAVWNTGDHGIQVAAEAIVRNNIVRGTAGFGIYSRDHQSAKVKDLRILHNTILGPRSIRIVESDGEIGEVFIANNALSSPAVVPGGLGIMMAGNVFDIAQLLPTRPRPGVNLKENSVEDDFVGVPRKETRDVGAYRYDPAGEYGWEVTEGFKRLLNKS